VHRPTLSSWSAASGDPPQADLNSVSAADAEDRDYLRPVHLLGDLPSIAPAEQSILLIVSETSESSASKDLARLQVALRQVQGDLDRTVTGGPVLQIVVLDVEHNWYHFTAYVADSNGSFWGGGAGLYGATSDHALASIADGIQDHMADLERLVWPLCHRHHLGLLVRPHGVAVDWTGDDGQFEGRPVWWCDGEGGHELAMIGELT
jgi:hypothetical protein